MRGVDWVGNKPVAWVRDMLTEGEKGWEEDNCVAGEL